MLVKRIKFTDFLNNVREQDYRFNLTEAELIELDLATDGGLKNLLEKLTDHQDVPALSGFFKDFIKRSYGVISDDGIDFIKNDEVWERFYRSNAYNALYMELITNEDAAMDFISKVFPKAQAPNGDDTKLVAIQKAKEKMAEQNR